MKLNYTVTAFAVSIAMLGCQKKEQPASEGTSALQQEMMEKSGQTSSKIGDTIESTKNRVAQGRQELIAATERTLNEVDAALSEFDQKATSLSADAKSGAESALAKLKEQRQVVGDQLEKAKKATSEAWQKTIQPGLESALKGLKDTYANVKASWPKN